MPQIVPGILRPILPYKSLLEPSLALLLLATPFIGMAGGGEEKEGKDTVPVFGLGELFDRTPLTLAYLERKKDSLERSAFVHREVLERLNSYMNAEAESKETIVQAIDALLDGEEVDKHRMRELHVMIAKWEAKERSPFLIPYGDEPFPAHAIYRSWDTKKIAPYAELHRRKGRKGEERRLRLIAPEWECGFALPVEGERTSDYGMRGGRMHHGIDLDLHVGDPVKAAFPGVVRISRYFLGYGRAVVIRHPNGLETLYAHLHRAEVKPGDHVEAGERIGSGGNTGRSTGSHLHFEVRYKGISLDPAHFISFEEKKLMGDTLVIKEQKHGFASYPAGTRFHTVQRGDFLYRISQRYGVSIRKLCELNGIRRNSTLWVGQRIRVSI